MGPSWAPRGEPAAPRFPRAMAERVRGGSPPVARAGDRRRRGGGRERRKEGEGWRIQPARCKIGLRLFAFLRVFCRPETRRGGGSYPPGPAAVAEAAAGPLSASPPRAAGWAAAIAGGSFVCRATGMSAPSCSRSRSHVAGPGEAPSPLASVALPQAGGPPLRPLRAEIGSLRVRGEAQRRDRGGGAGGVSAAAPFSPRLFMQPAPACNRALSQGAPHLTGLPAPPTHPPALSSNHPRGPGAGVLGSLVGSGGVSGLGRGNMASPSGTAC